MRWLSSADLVGVLSLGALTLVSPGPAAADGSTVPIRDLAFPPEVAALAGETVTWTNEDAATSHAVVSGVPGGAEAGQLFTSSSLQPGEAFSFTFEAPGAYEYHCSLHPTMRSVVVVAAL